MPKSSKNTVLSSKDSVDNSSSILLLVVTWILILVGWYVIGLPLGIGTSLTL